MTARTGDVIATVEELEALPDKTVMRTRTDQLAEIGQVGGKRVVWMEGWADFESATELLGPFTVLHVPGEQAEEPTKAEIEAARETISHIPGVTYGTSDAVLAEIAKRALLAAKEARRG